jgi:hypothetical protein
MRVEIGGAVVVNQAGILDGDGVRRGRAWRAATTASGARERNAGLGGRRRAAGLGKDSYICGDRRRFWIERGRASSWMLSIVGRIPTAYVGQRALLHS